MRFNFPKHASGDLAAGWNQTRRVMFTLHDRRDTLAVVPGATASMRGTADCPCASCCSALRRLGFCGDSVG